MEGQKTQPQPSIMRSSRMAHVSTLKPGASILPISNRVSVDSLTNQLPLWIQRQKVREREAALRNHRRRSGRSSCSGGLSQLRQCQAFTLVLNGCCAFSQASWRLQKREGWSGVTVPTVRGCFIDPELTWCDCRSLAKKEPENQRTVWRMVSSKMFSLDVLIKKL